MYQFGEYILDIQGHTLRHRDRQIYLRPKSFETLRYLVERQGSVVRKDDLLDGVWTGLVVTDGTLTHCIEEIRIALADDPHNPRFIQTLPRVGYRFLAPVERLSGGEVKEVIEDEFVTAVEVHVRDREEGAEHSRLRQALASVKTLRFRHILLILTVLIAVSVVLVLTRRREPAQVRIRSLAVLPFTNLGGNPEQEYFAEGLTDVLTAELSRIRDLRVISRTSAALTAGGRQSVQEIGRALQVDAVVEGTVILSGERVLITAQLIETDRDQHVWGESYEGDLTDVVSTVLGVTKSIAKEIRVGLTPQEVTSLSDRRTPDPVAYEAYLKGRYHWNKRTDEEFVKAVGYFKQALARDSLYAAAYAGLADCYNMLGNYDAVIPLEAYPKAKMAAEKALALDSTLSDAHASLGFTLMEFDWNWHEAEVEFRRAIDLNPNCVSAHHWFGLLHAMRGQFTEAEEEMSRARSLDPLSLIVLANIGWVRYFAGNDSGAVDILRECLQLSPEFISAHIKLGWSLEQLGRYQEATAEFREAVRLSKGDRGIRLMLVRALALAGERAEAEEEIGVILHGNSGSYVPSFHIALAFLALGNRERAMTYLKESVKERSGWLCWLNVDPKLDGLRADPRFAALQRSLALR
jgi:TolB-like protein/DNA-binding winged helix-turn-helix (wHTH) protein/tetratricopeptide (TPR) repeat protein